jgi:hypothetical protein
MPGAPDLLFVPEVGVVLGVFASWRLEKVTLNSILTPFWSGVILEALTTEYEFATEVARSTEARAAMGEAG